jgi:NAD(P)-dependent dehydrogenase (short-subunit alcohol dehydrogenase family)
MSEFAIYPSLKGKIIYITGGASGIGASTVRAFDRQGAIVGILDIDSASGKQLLNDLKGQHEFVQCDLRDINALTEAISTLESQLGKAQILVNNAASDDRHDWREIDANYWNERMDINLRHMFFAIQQIAPWMIDAREGSIVNVGSNSWWECGAGFPAYATAKSAVHGLTRTMARELGAYNIRVNTVVPGWIMTDRQKELWVTEKSIEKHIDRQCLPDLIDPIYVARMVLFLSSSDSAMCTANNYMVEAGSI